MLLCRVRGSEGTPGEPRPGGVSAAASRLRATTLHALTVRTFEQPRLGLRGCARRSPRRRCLQSKKEVSRCRLCRLTRCGSKASSTPAQPLAVVRQVAARHPARDRARIPVDRVRRAEHRRVLRDPVHGALSAHAVRVQRRRAALDVARLASTLRRDRHRPVPAFTLRWSDYPATSRSTTRSGSRAGSCSSSGGCSRSRSTSSLRSSSAARYCGARPAARPVRGGGAPVHRPLPALDLRFRARDEPLDAARGDVRGADDRPLPALPARRGPDRAVAPLESRWPLWKDAATAEGGHLVAGASCWSVPGSNRCNYPCGQVPLTLRVTFPNTGPVQRRGRVCLVTSRRDGQIPIGRDEFVPPRSCITAFSPGEVGGRSSTWICTPAP